MRISDWSSDVCSSDLERQDLSPNNLATFMALAGNDQYVARTHSGHRGGNGRPPIADLLRARGLGQYLLANCGRILAARIVVGDDGAVGQRRGDAAHDRALAAVAEIGRAHV